MKKKKILITGAGSGFGEGAALGLAQKGHDVIAGAHIWPQVTALREKAASLGIDNLRVEKLDICDPIDVKHALTWDIDILASNAGIGYGGPIAEIPLALVRELFETNVWAALAIAQQFIRKWVDAQHPAKIVFTSSVAGLHSVEGLGAYCASKHALEAVAETLQKELASYNIQIQTINPAAYQTGFNDAMAETALHWMDDAKNFNKKADVEKLLQSHFKNQRDPQEVIDAMIEIIPADGGKFRNVIPQLREESLKKAQADAWKQTI